MDENNLLINLSEGEILDRYSILDIKYNEIDDNSKKEFVRADYNYKNIETIQSEYPGCGELLPYVYFLKYRLLVKTYL